MPLTIETLREEVLAGKINTVVMGGVDMQGRLIGKRLAGNHFVEKLDETCAEISICRYFLAMNIEGYPGNGYEVATWEGGFGNCALRADLSTLRRTPWVPATALIIADPFDGPIPLFCSPRVILQRQVERLAQKGLKAKIASELEFFLFNESYSSARQKRWTQLDTAQPHHRCLHLLAGSVDEPFMQKVRTGLAAADIALEATHPEYGSGQNELNFVPAEPVEMADRHILAKMAVHEMAIQEGNAATFMAKYNKDDIGSSCHIHLSIVDAGSGKSAFFESEAEFGLSALGSSWIAGMVKYASEYTYFLAPYINSYKRLQPNSWAPTKLCWALDNRTSAFRLCNARSANIHVECRIGGADLNPYLAFAALLAAGLAGIDEGLKLPPPAMCNAYANEQLPDLPHTLREATRLLAESKMLKEAMGEQVLKHYVNNADLEQSEFDKQVTDWELMRCFGRC